jgi:hypothetical protein
VSPNTIREKRAGTKADKMRSNFWKDFNSANDWRFRDAGPSQIQELISDPIVDQSERERADWMWRRRPKLVLGEGFLGYCLVLTVGVSLPLIHGYGLFLDVVWLFISFLRFTSDTVRAVRWRRDYEASLQRLIRSVRSRGTI